MGMTLVVGNEWVQDGLSTFIVEGLKYCVLVECVGCLLSGCCCSCPTHQFAKGFNSFRRDNKELDSYVGSMTAIASMDRPP